jgi:hypothetical protein
VKRPRFRLLTRVALALAAVGLLPLLISSFGLVGMNREALEDQMQRTQVAAARTVAARLQAQLDTWTALARGTAANPVLADPHGLEAGRWLVAQLGSWSDLGVLAVALVNPAGGEVLRVQVKDAAGRKGLEEALRGPVGPTLLAFPAFDPPSAALVRIDQPLPGEVGAVRLIGDGAALATALSSWEAGEQARLVVVDRTGRSIFGALPAGEAFSDRLLSNALSGRVGGVVRSDDRQGRKVLSAYATVGGGDWTVLSWQPSAAAEALAARLSRRSFLAIAAALLLIVILLAWAFRAIVLPLRRLVADQRGLAKDFGARAAGNEIEELQESFQTLRKSLSEREALDDVFLGRYQVIEHLGTGAMGSVFRGWDPKLQRPVALKTIRVEASLDEKTQGHLHSTLTREAVMVARFNHPNVVAIYDLEDAPGAAFIAMEFVDGQSLDLLLWQHGKLKADAMIPLAAGIAHGLAAAHNRGIVHRDIKPANVLLGKDGSIKVSDFGIADLMAAAQPPGMAIFGTPGYVPPEVLQGASFERGGDLFALGVILYYGLTGRKPFAGRGVEDIIHATLFASPQPLGAGLEGVPPELERLIFRLLERDPDARLDDALVVAAELDRLAAARGLRWSMEMELTVERSGRSGRSGIGTRPALEAQWMPTTRFTVTNTRPAATGSSVQTPRI